MDICQHQTAKDQDWEDTASALNVKRAFASSVVVPKTDDDTEVLYLMGGYNSDDGFLDSVEKYDSTGDTWSVATPMAEPKSHFCAVMASPVSWRNEWNNSQIVAKNAITALSLCIVAW